MLGAIFIVHIKNGWNFGAPNGGGVEFQTLLLVVALLFLLKGNSVSEAIASRETPADEGAPAEAGGTQQ